MGSHINDLWSYQNSALKKTYLLPGVEFEGGDADFFNFIVTGSKQQVPIGFGWQRYLGDTCAKGVILRYCVRLEWTTFSAKSIMNWVVLI